MARIRLQRSWFAPGAKLYKRGEHTYHGELDKLPEGAEVLNSKNEWVKVEDLEGKPADPPERKEKDETLKTLEDTMDGPPALKEMVEERLAAKAEEEQKTAPEPSKAKNDPFVKDKK